MASAGRLHVTIEARVEKLEEGLARAERRVQHAQKRMQGFGDAAGQVAARGLRAMAAGMGAATAAAAAQDRQWVALSATILATFAAGGPVAGAIALIGAGIGILAAKGDEASKKWEESMKRIAAAVQKAAADVRSADEALFVGRGGTRGLFDLKESLRDVDALRSRLTDLQSLTSGGATPYGWTARLAERLGLLGDAEAARVRASTEAERARGELRGQRDLLDKRLEVANREASLLMQRISDENTLLRIEDERERKIKAITIETERMTDVFLELAAAGVKAPEGFETWGHAIAAAIENANRRIEQMPEKLRRISEGWQLVGDTAFTVLDGILIRGGKVDDVVRDVLRSLLSLGLRSAVNTVVSGVSSP